MAAITRRRPGMTALQRRNQLMGLLFVSPWILGFLLWTFYPLGSSFYYSLTRYDLLREPIFIGLENYSEIFTRDPLFGKVTYNTLYYVGLSAPLGVAAAFLMASLLNTEIKGRSIFRAIFFFPAIIPAFVTAVVWQFLVNVQYGAINGTLQGLGLPVIPFIANPDYAKPTLILIHIWAQGNAIVIFLATLQEVPRSLYEAATVDGANAWHKFWNVTIPMTTPVILFNLVIGLIYGFQNFTLPWLLTAGGPNNATELYTIFLYRNAFQYLRMGKASALAWILFVVIVVFTILLFRSSNRWVYYGGESD
ncbi:MAG: sugar ABC transporter permease [Caldilineaceae bacterium]|nr:sugar ABC transporter permease [Caldilineaceae bacterium]